MSLLDEAFAELQEKLQGMTGDNLRRAQRKALKRVGEMFQDAIVERAPEKTGESGVLAKGELKESIGVRVSVPTDEGVIKGKAAKVTIGPRGQAAKLVAADVEYGHANPRAKKGMADTPAHPFIRPAFDATESAAIADYTEEMEAFVEKAAK